MVNSVMANVTKMIFFDGMGFPVAISAQGSFVRAAVIAATTVKEFFSSPL
jgi:hypothetical protein